MAFPVLILICPAILAVLGASGLAILYYAFPGKFFTLYMRFAARRAGFTTKFVQAGEWTFCYHEKGRSVTGQPSMFCFHGFSSSKDQWIEIGHKLPKDIHIVALDLVGHGQTNSRPNCKVDFHTQARQAHTFAEAVGLTESKIHVVGSSMGGAIAGIYAALYPDEVLMVTMMCPAMKTPVETDFQRELKSGKCRLIPTTTEGVQHMFDLCMYNKKTLPTQILKGILKVREPHEEYYNYVFSEASKAGIEDDLVKEASNISMPSQIMWGDHDEMIHPSGITPLRETLPDLRQVDVLDKCGHTMMIDRPGAVTKALSSFRDKVINSSK